MGRFAVFLSCRAAPWPLLPLRLIGSRPTSQSHVAGTAKSNIGFTLIELLVVLAIIALLALLVAPAVQRAIVSSNYSKATANMRALAGAVQIYTTDNQGTFPRMRGPGADWSWESLWPTTIAPYTTGKTNVPNSAYDKIYLNPLEKNHHRFTDFGCNSYIFANDKANRPPREAVKLASVPRPSKTIMLSMAQEKSGTTLKGTWYIESETFVDSGTNSQSAKPSDLGLGRISFINVDGSSSSLPWDEFVERRAELLDPQQAK